MCGIAAVFAQPLEPDVLARALEVVSRRGPECTRSLVVYDGLFVHAALRFVDVHANQQPLVLPDGSVLIWNGEIYNWRELCQQYGFEAENDTQTLLLGLRAQGARFLSEIDGQFAFIALLVDEVRAAQLLVGRDKWGICPLVFGNTAGGGLAIASTHELLQVFGVRISKTLPAGTCGVRIGNELSLEVWYRLPRVPAHLQAQVEPGAVLRFAEQRVQSRIPDDARDLFTTMGGIDSQFVTACVARTLRGEFGGAVTVVPFGQGASDYAYVKQTLAQLASEGITVPHHVAALTPEFVHKNVDRLLKLLGPDMFHLICALGEDLVAETVQRLGGRTIMTAGGPDEAGRSYDRWTFLHRGLDEELAWHRLGEQFASSEGVRAGLVFGERGIENRVPLADLIELATQMRADQKQRVHCEGDGLRLATLRMEGKIFWREALCDVLPRACLDARKEPIHGSTGAMFALLQVLRADVAYQRVRARFALWAFELGWNGIVFADLRALNPNDPITECQLYALYRWSLLEPELFRLGGEQRYGRYVGYLPRSEDEPVLRAHKPLCYDWQLGPDVPLRALL